MWGIKLNLLSKMMPKNLYWSITGISTPSNLRTGSLSPKLTKMHTLGFGLGEFKAVLQDPLLNFIETLLKLTFDSMDMFRSVTDQKVVNI